MAEPARRDLAKAAGVTAAATGVVLLRGPAPALFSGPGGGHGVDHGPASPIGPLHWGPSGFRPVAWAWASLWPASGPARWPPLRSSAAPSVPVTESSRPAS